jgi:hypothetical protein
MTDKQPETQYDTRILLPIYVASRASIPERGAMWRRFRRRGIPITSSWIDEDADGQTADFSELWERIIREVVWANSVVLYAESNDFPLKGAFIEVGIALGMGKHVIVCLPDVELEPRSYRPIGSWINHPLVTRIDDIEDAVRIASSSTWNTRVVLPTEQGEQKLRVEIQALKEMVAYHTGDIPYTDEGPLRRLLQRAMQLIDALVTQPSQTEQFDADSIRKQMVARVREFESRWDLDRREPERVEAADQIADELESMELSG